MKLLEVTKGFSEILNKEPTISFGRHIGKPVSNKRLVMRKTKRACSSVRNTQEDKLASFVKMDKTTLKSAHSV